MTYGTCRMERMLWKGVLRGGVLLHLGIWIVRWLPIAIGLHLGAAVTASKGEGLNPTQLERPKHPPPSPCHTSASQRYLLLFGDL